MLRSKHVLRADGHFTTNDDTNLAYKDTASTYIELRLCFLSRRYHRSCILVDTLVVS